MIEYLRAYLMLKTDNRAVTALEYGLIAALIAAVIVTVVSTLGKNVSSTFATIGSSI